FVTLSNICYGRCYLFVVFFSLNSVALVFGFKMFWTQGIVDGMRIVSVLYVIRVMQNCVRSISLQFVSSNALYDSDIDPRDVIKQTQVLNPWWMVPFQLFCCNFGSTHAIHHFVVKEPFYIRQLTSKTAHKVMKEVGVRFNDVGTFKRMNRWNDYKI